MIVTVHIKRSVQVEIPDALVPTRKDRYGHTAGTMLAVDAALKQLDSDAWREERPAWGGQPSWRHPALSWIDWNSHSRDPEGNLSWEPPMAMGDTPPTSRA